MAEIIDGKTIALKIREEAKEEVGKLSIKPHLSAILVGTDPASATYVKSKEKACAEAGIQSDVYRLGENIKQEEILKLIQKLNADKSIHGILVQLPLPDHLNEGLVLNTVLPHKDVDGIHPENMGRLLRGEEPLFTPCTPLGIMDLIHSTGVPIKGQEAVVIGRSIIVGKPVALLLLKEHATVTICHTRTRDLSFHTKRADILVVAAGRPKVVTADMVKQGAIVIDVGMNRTEAGLVGDVDFENVKNRVGFISPVPGGVGPMTIARLLSNTLKAAKRAYSSP